MIDSVHNHHVKQKLKMLLTSVIILSKKATCKENLFNIIPRIKTKIWNLNHQKEIYKIYLKGKKMIFI